MFYDPTATVEMTATDLTHVTVYGNRNGPGTWDKFAPIVASLLRANPVVTVADMQAATERKWILGFLKSVHKTIAPVTAVRVGRKTIGYRFVATEFDVASSVAPLVSVKSKAVRGPNGRFLPKTA
jgi:hypothetical protein